MLAASSYRKISDYLKDRQQAMGPIYYDRIDMSYGQSDKNELLPRLYENQPLEVAGFSIREVKSYLSSRGVVNGLKFIFKGDCRWLLIRSSETEDMIRFYAEGQTGEEVSGLLRQGQNLLLQVSGNIIHSKRHKA